MQIEPDGRTVLVQVSDEPLTWRAVRRYDSKHMGEPADVNTRLRRLPKVDEVLREEPALRLLERAPRWAVVDAIRLEIESLRVQLRAGGEGAEAPGNLDGEAIRARVEAMLRPSLVRVLNAT